MFKKFNIIIIIIIAFAVLNINLLTKIIKLTKENHFLRSKKVTLTLSEQLKLLEEKMEGRSINLDEFYSIKTVFNEEKRYTLIYQFWGNNCRECMHREITEFTRIKSKLQNIKNLINVIIVFSGFEMNDFITLVRQYDIKEYAVSDSSYIFLNQIDLISVPGIFLLNNDRIILLSYFSIFDEPFRIQNFYRKLFYLLGLYSKT